MCGALCSKVNSILYKARAGSYGHPRIDHLPGHDPKGLAIVDGEALLGWGYLPKLDLMWKAGSHTV
jgi:hypothetical protein